ncbi:MAG: glycosyltransferase [Deltaproteobacteria bacterium]|nr:glycosyltransferase [Deltaproteobacteria bacterium]
MINPVAFGRQLYEDGRLEEAMALLGKALASDPTDVMLLNTLGRISFENGLTDTSEAFALKAARLDRRCVDALIHLVRICMARGQYERANELSRYVVDIDRTQQSVMEEIMGPHRSHASISVTTESARQGGTLKILVINNLYPPQNLGGYGRFIADFADVLGRRGHDIHVLTSDTPNDTSPVENEPHVQRDLYLFGVWNENGQRLFDRDQIISILRKNQETLCRTLNTFQPDICLVGNIDLLGMPVFTPIFNQQVPVAHYWGNEFPGYEPSDCPRNPLYHVVTASNWLKGDAIRRGYPVQDAHIVYPGAFVESFKMGVPPETDKLRIVYAGLIIDSKGPQVLVEALCMLAKNGIDFACSIAGGTMNTQFKDRLIKVITDFGLGEKIRFTGRLNREELKDLYATHNVIVFPSLANETFGISQVEGMAAGLLLITSGPGGAREVIEDGKSGLFFEPGNAALLAGQLLGLTRNRSMWERIALNGQKRAMELFDVERSGERLESMLSRVVDQQQRDVGPVPGVHNRKRPIPGNGFDVKDEIQDVRPVRMELARLWLKTPLEKLQELYQGNSGKWQKRFACPELKSFPLTPEEQNFVDHEVALLSGDLRDNGLLQHVLAAMLFLHPYQMPIALDLEKVPHWFQWDYFKFLIEAPYGVLQTGETDAYYRHIKDVVQTLAGRIRMAPNSKLCAEMAQAFLTSCFIPLYFSRRPLKDLYVSRGEIFQYVWDLAGCELEYQFPPRPLNRERIRLGIRLSNLQSVTELRATLPLFEYLDRETFEVFLYVSEPGEDDRERYCPDLVDHFVVMPQDLGEWGRTIRSDDLDILIFGNNSTARVNSSTILATHRLARLQCVHFCSPVTTGLKHMDYFLLGTLIDPEGKGEAEYSEKLLRLPGSGICFSMGSPSESDPHLFTRKALGIPEKGVLFVSGANFNKITPELRSTWARIIASVPESVLVLYPFGPAWSRSYPERRFAQEMAAVFTRYGIAEERLVVLKPFKKRDHITSFLMLADVYLDATPYSGATSLLEPFEAGLPTVVTEGAELRFCQGAAMLKELGVPDLVAGDEEAYVRLAIRLGRDPDLRKVKSLEIREKMAQGPPFLDPRSYAEKVGRALKTIMAREGLITLPEKDAC